MRVEGSEIVDVALAQPAGHGMHLVAFARLRLVTEQRLLQIFNALAGQHREARIGAVAVDAVAAIAAFDPFRGGKRLAHARRLRFLRGEVSRQVLYRAIVERAGKTLHSVVGARSVFVADERRNDILRVLSGQTRRPRTAAHAVLAMTSDT